MKKTNTSCKLGSVASKKSTLHTYPLVSIVLLSRNEKMHIGGCIESLLNSNYPGGNIELLVVDGMSTDGTAAIVDQYARRDSRVKRVINPKVITPAAMNVGVKAAKGEVIAIVGAHAQYSPDFLKESVRYLYEYEADQAGVALEYRPRENTWLARAMAIVLRHSFGAGANAGYKKRVSQPIWVDTVFGGCFRRELFSRIGLFNEDLVHSQDMEWNQRLRQAGGKILLVPNITNQYYARSDLRSFSKHNFRNGLWVVLPFLYSQTIPVRPRHLVPFAFVLTLLISAALAGIVPGAAWTFAAVLISYGVACGIASVSVAVEEHHWQYLFIMPVVFFLLHAVHGIGSLWGIVRLATQWMRGPSTKLAEGVTS